MRKLLLKNLVSKDKKRTELFLSEHFEKDDVVQEIEKRTVYKIKDILQFTDLFDLELFLDLKKKDNSFPQRYIVRSHSTRTGIMKFIYKVVGEQCVVLNDRVFVLKVSQYVKKIIIKKNQKLIAEKS